MLKLKINLFSYVKKLNKKFTNIKKLNKKKPYIKYYYLKKF